MKHSCPDGGSLCPGVKYPHCSSLMGTNTRQHTVPASSGGCFFIQTEHVFVLTVHFLALVKACFNSEEDSSDKEWSPNQVDLEEVESESSVEEQMLPVLTL